MVKQFTQTKTELLQIFHDLPPVKLKFFFKATEEQIEHFKANKIHWKSIEIGLKAYFSGLSIENLIEAETKLKPTNLMILDIYKWIKLYDLLNFGWSYIESFIDKTPYVLLSTYGCPEGKSKLANPGDALKFILEQISYYSFSECLLPYYTFSPQDFRNKYNYWNKISAKKAINEPLTKSEKNNLKKMGCKYDNSFREQYMEGYFLLEHFLEILSKSRNKLIKKLLKEYLKADAESRKEKLKHWHPRKKPKGHSWANGKYLKGKKGGYA